MSQDIYNALARYFRAIDERDWTTARSLMSDPFHVDYSSFGAGPAADVSPDDVLGGWAAFLPGFDATHHQLGNIDLEVDGETAEVRCYVTGNHVIGADVWTVVGAYDISLLRENGRWVLRLLRFNYSYLTGALELPDRARLRASQD